MTDKRPKICCVCGDKALGKNLGAITCESCKAFFRRTVLRANVYIPGNIKELKCPFNDQCKINKDTRKLCQKCRFKKCVAMGMKIDSLVTEKHRDIKNQNSIEKIRKISVGSEYMSDSTARSSPDPTEYSHNGYPESDTTVNMEVEIITPPVIAIDWPIDAFGFTESEGNKLTEILSAVSIITDPYVEKCNSEVTQTDQLESTACYKFMKKIGKLVEFAKRLNSFRDICQDDQIALIKYGCTEVLAMRSIITYNAESEAFHLCMDKDQQIVIKLHIDVFKGSREGVYSSFKGYLTAMSREWESDPVIIHLLSVVMLFNPNLSEVNHKDVIHLHQKTYIHLLQKYLQLRYGSESISKQKLFKLIKLLNDVYSLGSLFRFHAKRRNDLSPLVAEIFDSPRKT